jgi:hypothetical protein
MTEKDVRTAGKGDQVFDKVFLKGLEGGGGISAGKVRDMMRVIEGLGFSLLLQRHDGWVFAVKVGTMRA